MSTAYYYFAATLPLLEFGAQLPMSFEAFLEDCERLLSPKDFRELQSVVSDTGNHALCDNAVLREWQKFLHNLRNEGACRRASAMGKDPSKYMRGERTTDPAAHHILSEVRKSTNPLAAEKLIDEAKWQKLDELVHCHFFDFEFILVYAVKLKILERYSTIASLGGQEIFEEYKKKAKQLR